MESAEVVESAYVMRIRMKAFGVWERALVTV